MGRKLASQVSSTSRLLLARAARRPGLLAALGCVIVLLLPLAVKSGYLIHIMIMIAFFAYLGVSWNILGGFAGQMSIGHGVFAGIGAYASTLLYMRLGVNPWIAMILAALGCAILASLVGYLLFRLRDAFFALSTMALLKVVTLLAVYFRGLTNGNLGISLPMREGVLQLTFGNKTGYFYLAVALLALGTVVSSRIRRSRLGLNLLALRDDHDAAESLGIDTHMSKVIALGVSALLVSLGGSFYAHYVLYIDPQVIFDPKISLQMPLVSILGGLGTVAGPIVGSVLMVPTDAILRTRFGGQVGGLNFLIYGFIIIIVVRFFPEGVIPKLRTYMRKVLQPDGGTASQKVRVRVHVDSRRSPAGGPHDSRPVVVSPGTLAPGDPVLEVRRLTVRFAGLTAVKDLSMSVGGGEIVGLIGPNGAGKTTVFNAITGYVQPTSGSVVFSGKEIKRRTKPHRLCRVGITRTFQIVRPFRQMTLLENVMVGTISSAKNYGEAERKARAILEDVGLAEQADASPRGLTIAGQKKLELARALAVQPTLLMLDEPMAGLNPSEVEDMVAFVRRIAARGTSILIIEHVMKAIMSLCERIVVLDHGERIAEGSPAEVANDQRVIDVYLGERYHA